MALYNSNFVATPINKSLEINGLRWNLDESQQMHRSPFSKDRDRILYSKSFLRLRGKTQIFMLHRNDYIRTRLTHSLEVNQIAKSIASALCQNLDLVEAIALGHDVGHTPFGHIGERTLAELIKNDQDIPAEKRGFKHNLQALRLLCDLEKGADYPEHKGLNLTKYTLWGIAHHSSTGNHPFYNSYLASISNFWSYEGLIVAIADEIAQRHHDIEDGLRYGIISRKELIDEIKKFQPLFKRQDKECFRRLDTEKGTLEEPVFNSLFARLVVNLYITDVIEYSKMKILQLERRYNITNQEQFKENKARISENEYKECISFSPQMQQCDSVFHTFLKERILDSFQTQAMDGKAEYIIKKLYYAFRDNPLQLPDTSLFSFADIININTHKRKEITNNIIGANRAEFHRCIVDYIGGMTDNFAYDEFDRLYGTRV